MTLVTMEDLVLGHDFRPGTQSDPSVWQEPIMPNQDPDTIKLVDMCRKYLSVFCKTIFPDAFGRPFSPHIHDKIFDVLEDPTIRELVIASNRGSGKTSIILSFMAWLTLFCECPFIIVVSHSLKKIMEDTETLKHELRTNEQILRLFGSIETKDNFAKDRWIARNTATGVDTMVLPRGAETQIRGWKYGFHRPGVIIVDDLEDPKHRDSEEVRRKKERWFFSDVCNAVDLGAKDWRIIVIGTVLHEQSLVWKLLHDPDWTPVHLQLANDQDESLWPEFITTADLKKKKEAARRRGLLDDYYLEFRNIPQAAEDCPFKAEYFIPYSEETENLDAREAFANVVIVDPAREAKIHCADTAIVGAGVDLTMGSIYFRDIMSGKFHLDESWAYTIAMMRRLKTHIVGIEITGLGEEYGTYPFMDYASSVNYPVHVIPLRSKNRKDDKILRIRQMTGFYRMGRIRHNPLVCGVLENQLLTFPFSELWDVMDAASRIIELMDEGQILCPYVETDPVEKFLSAEKDSFDAQFKRFRKEDKAYAPVGRSWCLPWTV